MKQNEPKEQKFLFHGTLLLGLFVGLLIVVLSMLLPDSEAAAANANVTGLPVTSDMPYRQAGLSERQAAAYLLDRLSFGARPGDVDHVVAIGLNCWVQQQLQGGLPEPELKARLKPYPAMTMTPQQIAARYPGSSILTAHVRRFYNLVPPANSPVDFNWVTGKLDEFRKEKGLVLDRFLYDEMTGQKIMRAVYSENQLTEVLIDFWTNHFYTSTTNFRSAPWVLTYERDAIRPNVLGRFSDLLKASATHPAMLQYLENAQSALVTDEHSLMAFRQQQLRNRSDLGKTEIERILAGADKELQAIEADDHLILDKKFRPREGIKESYASMLLAAHTLGPDGGQTAQDVHETARVFSGWGNMTMGASPEWFKVDLVDSPQLGFVRDGSFFFRADWHDAEPKQVLGKSFPAGGGIEEGRQLLDVLASHPATARHISRKLATRFVSEQPSQALVDHLAQAFTASKGNIRQVMQTLVASPEFWEAAQQRNKVKSPFELTVSALRAVKADVRPDIATTKSLADWIALMGQPLYGYQVAPTGFPDRAEFWAKPGNLTQRLNFALNLGAGQIDGVSIKPALLTRNQTTTEPGQVLALYAHSMLPERDVTQTVNALQPVVQNPHFLAAFNSPVGAGTLPVSYASTTTMMAEITRPQTEVRAFEKKPAVLAAKATANPATTNPLARVVGMIVGSPQFQTY